MIETCWQPPGVEAGEEAGPVVSFPLRRDQSLNLLEEAGEEAGDEEPLAVYLQAVAAKEK